MDLMVVPIQRRLPGAFQCCGRFVDAHLGGLARLDDHSQCIGDCADLCKRDVDFFLELLPGPRDRDGLPESIRFWKTKIEERDPDQTFSVGLINGPSGCGKSSLVKAGLLPRLDNQVLTVYVESTYEETEVRLLKGLKKCLPDLPETDDLPQVFLSFRERGMSGGRKLLIVLDQFEQWLHANHGEETSQLVAALRHCDGANVQCIVMVRDDFWTAATRFATSLDIRFQDGINSHGVDLFGEQHARNVLKAFGKAYGRLTEEVSDEQRTFVEQAIGGLAEGGKVVSVRISLFADMTKEKEWCLDTLKEVGGTEGVGVTFLEETFSASTAPPEHRLHQRASRAVLKALLPESGTDIKGHMRSHDELLAESGYATRPRDFDDLLRILDTELRLITPTDPEGALDDDRETGVPRDAAQRYYQLTHDYLVPSLQEWLTRKQRETRQGRAELRLADRAALWNAKPENRHLPSLWEYGNIRLLTEKKKWTESQRNMMRWATRTHTVRWGTTVGVLVLVVAGIWRILETNRQENLAKRLENSVNSMATASWYKVPDAITDLEDFPSEMVRESLRQKYAKAKKGQKLSLAYALAAHGQVELEFLLSQIADAPGNECANIVTALDRDKDKAIRRLAKLAQEADEQSDWILKGRLAVVGLQLGDASIAEDIHTNINRPDPTQQTVFIHDVFPTWHGDLKRLAVMAKELTELADKPVLPSTDVAVSYDWGGDPLDPTWLAPTASVVEKLEAAQGMVSEDGRFAFCQSLPLRQFQALADEMGKSGFRPTRLRPYSNNESVHVAAAWTRDGRQWRSALDQSRDELVQIDEAHRNAGFVAVDVAGYVGSIDGTPSELYAALWVAKLDQTEDARLYAGALNAEHKSVYGVLHLDGFNFQHSLQGFRGLDGQDRFCGVKTNADRSGGTWSWRQTTSLFEAATEKHADKIQRDIDLSLPARQPTWQERNQTALAAAELKLQASKDDPALRYSRGTAFFNLEQDEAAVDDLSFVISNIAPDSSTYRSAIVYRAILHARGGEPEQANADLAQFKQVAANDDRLGYLEFVVANYLGEDPKAAAARLEAFVRDHDEDTGALYNAACAFSVGAKLAREKDPENSAAFAARAVSLLQKAVSHGYDNYTHMRQDADLDSIREHADFVELMKAGSLTLNLRYSAVWNSHPGFTSMELHGLSPSDHLRECAQLSQDGCRVVAISAAVVDGELLTASVWHRPAGEFQFPERVETKSEQARSLLAGLCLAVGNVTDLVGAKDDWKSLASVWFTKSPDSGTHSAASWTLRQWDVELPAIKATAESPQDRHWQVTKTGLTLVHFPAGQFELDDGKTKQPVTLTRGFWLCDREVSVGSFQQFMDDEEYLGRKPKDWEGADVDISPSDEHPVQQVSWEDAVLFCNWLSWREGLEPCYEVEPLAKPDGQSRATLQVDWLTSATGYRLPTESEWEYACRGGATTEFCLGDDTERLRRYAVYGATKSEAVGNHLCNRHGLFDMHGNVYEWCYDWYGERESTLAVDPSGSSQGSVRVYRGGCWYSNARYCQSGFRNGSDPPSRGSNLGFRVARGPSPSKPVSGAESGSR